MAEQTHISPGVFTHLTEQMSILPGVVTHLTKQISVLHRVFTHVTKPMQILPSVFKHLTEWISVLLSVFTPLIGQIRGRLEQNLYFFATCKKHREKHKNLKTFIYGNSLENYQNVKTPGKTNIWILRTFKNTREIFFQEIDSSKTS